MKMSFRQPRNQYFVIQIIICLMVLFIILQESGLMYNYAFYKKVIMSFQINVLLIVVPHIYLKKRGLIFKC